MTGEDCFLAKFEVLAEEGHPPASLYDFVQGITAHARTKTNQDTRLEIEGKARKLLEKVN
jgi:hypothetical protein